MRKTVSVFICALTLSIAGTTAVTAPALAQDKAQAPNTRPYSFANLSEKLLPAVVNISSTQKAPEVNLQEVPEGLPHFPEGSPFENFFEDFLQRRGGEGFQAQPQSSLGSGFIIDAERGYIITNNHVINDADEVRVTFHDDQTVDAEIIGRDEKTDIAVLKVETDKKLSEVKLGNSDQIRVGDWILAIGNPFGLGGTVTAGIVSARARDINSGPYDDYLQTDASINRGNSGGPMFNLDGEVIGINTAIFSPSGGSIGIGFAIPSTLAKPIIAQLIEYGRTRRGWLGVRIQHVTEEIADSLGLPDTSGALVASVTKGGPSEASGLKAGDIILELNDTKGKEMRELPRLVAETKIGSKAKVTYWRDGKKATTTVNIGELEKAEETGLIEENAPTNQKPAQNGVDMEDFGFTLTELNDGIRTQYGIDSNVNGLVVTKIKPSSEAAQKGLFEGDVIVEVNQTMMKSTKDFSKVVKVAKEKNRTAILLLINREGSSRFLALKIDDKD